VPAHIYEKRAESRLLSNKKELKHGFNKKIGSLRSFAKHCGKRTALDGGAEKVHNFNVPVV
jgi:hypothetical protein